MKLNQPTYITSEFRQELPEAYDYLADSGRAFIAVTCKPAGYLNIKLAEARDSINRLRRVRALENAEIKDKAEYVKRADALQSEIGAMHFAALYDHCIDGWSTNIQDADGPMTCNKDSFLALMEVRIAEIATFGIDLVKHIENVAGFIKRDDEATLKN